MMRLQRQPLLSAADLAVGSVAPGTKVFLRQLNSKRLLKDQLYLP